MLSPDVVIGLQNRFGDNRLNPGQDEDPERFKARRRIKNGYTDYLPEEDVNFIDRAIEAASFKFERFLEASQ